MSKNLALISIKDQNLIKCNMKSNFMPRKQKQNKKSSKASSFRISSCSIRISSEKLHWNIPFYQNKSHGSSGNLYQNVSTPSKHFSFNLLFKFINRDISVNLYTNCSKNACGKMQNLARPQKKGFRGHLALVSFDWVLCDIQVMFAQIRLHGQSQTVHSY